MTTDQTNNISEQLTNIRIEMATIKADIKLLKYIFMPIVTGILLTGGVEIARFIITGKP
jgi:hypothetical protein